MGLIATPGPASSAMPSTPVIPAGTQEPAFNELLSLFAGMTDQAPAASLKNRFAQSSVTPSTKLTEISTQDLKKEPAKTEPKREHKSNDATLAPVSAPPVALAKPPIQLEIISLQAQPLKTEKPHAEEAHSSTTPSEESTASHPAPVEEIDPRVVPKTAATREVAPIAFAAQLTDRLTSSSPSVVPEHTTKAVPTATTTLQIAETVQNEPLTQPLTHPTPPQEHDTQPGQATPIAPPAMPQREQNASIPEGPSPKATTPAAPTPTEASPAQSIPDLPASTLSATTDPTPVVASAPSIPPAITVSAPNPGPQYTQPKQSAPDQWKPAPVRESTVKAPSPEQNISKPLASVQPVKKTEPEHQMDSNQEKPQQPAAPETVRTAASVDPLKSGSTPIPPSPVTNRPIKADSTAQPDSPPPPKVELKTEINPASRAQPTRDISLRLPGADSSNVDLRVTERDGKVQVSVRTPDVELTKSLQSDIGELVGRLERKGFDTEVWTPLQQHGVTTASPGDKPGGDSGQSQTRDQGGNGSQQDSGQRQQQGQNQRQRPRWLEELEKSDSFKGEA